MSRRTRDELRQLMIDAGCELLVERGLAFDPPNLTYANVFEHLEQTRGVKLHRSQVHGRIWDSQDHYRVELVIATINNAATGSAEVDELVQGLTTPEQSAQVRLLANAWAAASTKTSRDNAALDLSYDLLVAAQALSSSGSSTPAAVADAATENLRQRTSHNERRYAEVAERLGVTVAEEFGISQDEAASILARNSSSLLEGNRLVESVDAELGLPFHLTDDEDNPQVRDAATLGLCLFVEQLFALDGPEA